VTPNAQAYWFKVTKLQQQLGGKFFPIQQAIVHLDENFPDYNFFC